MTEEEMDALCARNPLIASVRRRLPGGKQRLIHLMNPESLKTESLKKEPPRTEIAYTETKLDASPRHMAEVDRIVTWLSRHPHALPHILAKVLENVAK